MPTPYPGGAGDGRGGVVGGADTHWVVRLNGRNRALFFLAVLVVLALHQPQMQAGVVMWALLVLQFAVYPALVYWRAVRAPDPLRAELQALLIDGVLLGGWMAVWGLPLWISFMLAIAVCLNVVIYMGLSGLRRGLAALVAGVAGVGLVAGIDFRPDTELVVSVLCIGLLTLYLLFFAQAAYLRGVSLRQSRKALGQQLEQITQLQARLQEQVLRDPLTGLYNRRHADTVLAHELDACRATSEPLVVVLLDIDHFKRINDEYGHTAGDAVLRQLAAILKSASRAEDMVFRYGGEEFSAILTNANLKIALQIGERIRALIEKADFVWEKQHIPVTISIGAAVATGTETDSQELIQAADAALYEAKERGRNRVVASTAA